MMYASMLQEGNSYSITYTNADGMTSEREITVRAQWSNYGHDYIRAYCHSRCEDRTFRLDRIENAAPVNIARTEIQTRSAPVIKQDYQKPREYKRPAAAHPVWVSLSALFVIMVFFISNIDDSNRSRTYRQAPGTTAASRAAKPQPQKTPAWEQALELRKAHYSAVTGFNSERLLNIYTSADLNYDNILSWQEIDMFQKKINQSFSYINNNTALNPVDFLINGGGDCEDWSIFTCGMLRFWGYTAYVGVVDGGNGSGLHAIALFYKKTPPANRSYSYYQFDTSFTFYNITLPAGCYLPIDYNHTGSFSNASRPDSPLHYVYIPEEIYGRSM